MVEIRKIIFAMMVLILGCSYAVPQHTTAKATTEMYVHAKNDIVLRAEPKQNAKKLGTIKNHSKVTVISSAKEWSYVQAGKSKGYVYTSALSKKNPKSASTTVTGGLAPKAGLILTYAPSFLEEKKETFTVEKEDEYTYLYNKKSSLYPDLSNFTYIEDGKRLLMGVSSSDHIFINVPYPLKQGATIIDSSLMFEEQKVLVESTTKTVTVKAGTFKNVVILRYPSGSRVYFAKGIGILKIADKNGKIFTELVSVKEGK
ncbi:SH3 domain-containing protein [Saccharococcus sp. Marseille-Q5394]|uniref:SH3 domain-containing protein n=1 Tax=Saccharococcus sp. Marseille-Q5394 TaxID=2972778 RepID=UPI0021CA41ED|nr:SH3 domain-containing protein [Saccharococcus sp. Marseille-Q5394]